MTMTVIMYIYVANINSRTASVQRRHTSTHTTHTHTHTTRLFYVSAKPSDKRIAYTMWSAVSNADCGDRVVAKTRIQTYGV